ncbi:MAG TPA: zinc-finger domain-containing protein [Caulobacteraceae bacterium]|nr:zinc-finger domain-containing protein [Caulobacteraceae bacterium]
MARPPRHDPEPAPARPALAPDLPPAEVVRVRSKRVACDGGGPLGHPRVWLEMGEADFVECGYCDRRFVLAADAEREDERLDPGAYEGPGSH